MQQNSLKITILGSGTSTGIPVIGCRCPVCTSSLPKNKRTRCSALMSYNGRNILIDTSTDLRRQMLREDVRSLDAVFYTHSHADHVHGIDDLRAFNLHANAPLPLYGAAQTLNRIQTSFKYIFNNSSPNGYVPKLDLCPIDEPVDLFGLSIEPILLEHGWIKSFGYRCGPIAYLTDCNGIPEESLKKLEGLKLLVLDGLRFTPHQTHFNIPQAVEAAQAIGAEQTVLTHLSHEVDHSLHDSELPPGINLAYDGQTFSFLLGEGIMP